MADKKTILIADDERVTREVLAKMLTNAGYEVIVAEDGKTAVEKAATDKPDLVIMDGLMPKMHGFLACKAIKSLPAPPRVIMLTGVYTYKCEAKGEFEADGLLTKPIDYEVLLEEIDSQLSGPIGTDASLREALRAFDMSANGHFGSDGTRPGRI